MDPTGEGTRTSSAAASAVADSHLHWSVSLGPSVQFVHPQVSCHHLFLHMKSAVMVAIAAATHDHPVKRVSGYLNHTSQSTYFCRHVIFSNTRRQRIPCDISSGWSDHLL